MNRKARTDLAVRSLTKAIRPAPPDSGYVPMVAATGVVKTVTAAGATDGNAMLEVTVHGSDTLAPYLASYTSPTVGDAVLVCFLKGSPLILGRVQGPPTF